MLSQYEEKMQKSLDNLEAEYATIRAGRANPNILNKLRVEYYGVPTPMQQLANITVPEARTLMIAPWEPSLVKEIEKAIMNSDIGITPNNDGRNIILNFPELTEDRRKELVKDIKKKGEAAKVAIRNIRRDANDAIKKMEKSGAKAYSVNTGWNGTGKRISIKDTRGIIDAILSGAINTAPTKKIPMFDFEVPTELPGVDPAILDPRDTYADPTEWETKAKDLAARFEKNFQKYTTNDAGKALVAAGPKAE